MHVPILRPLPVTAHRDSSQISTPVLQPERARKHLCGTQSFKTHPVISLSVKDPIGDGSMIVGMNNQEEGCHRPQGSCPASTDPIL